MITRIDFPNTVEDSAQTSYIVGKNKIIEIKPIMKAGEMSSIQWFQIINMTGYVVAEIKESICNVYYEHKERDREQF